jgi:non-ribosomal peptide synthetase component F
MTGSERDRYGIALALLLACVVVFAAADEGTWGRVLVLVTQAVAVLAVFRASRLSRRLQRLSVTLVAALIAVGSLGVVAGDTGGHVAPSILALLLVVAAPTAIVHRLSRHLRIDMTTVLGALCLYVLVGLAFAYLYLLLDEVTAAAFFVQVDPARSIDFVEFSFVTLATLGYGDLTAAGDLGRMLAVLQTVLGQLYLVGVVAVVVSKLGTVRGDRVS